MAHPPNRCIFCGARVRLTQEHIFSRWTHRFVPKTKGAYQRLIAEAHFDRTDYKRRKKPGDILDWQVRCVCEAHCNNGWMRRNVEDIAKPTLIQLMKGEDCRIAPEQQRQIATWAIMKAMVSQYDRTGIATVHYRHRRLMMTKQAPPEDGWAVWIGHFQRGETCSTRWFSVPFQLLEHQRLLSRPNRKVTKFNSTVFNQIIGKLFIQTIQTPHRALVRDWRFDLPDGGALIRIWPRTTVSVVWPPAAMSDRDANFAMNAIRQDIEESVRRNVRVSDLR
jgi:hypothetical protein